MARATQKTAGFRWRLWLSLLALGVVGVSTAMAALKVRQFVVTDPRFALSRDAGSLTITGLRYTERSKVLRIFAGDFDHSIFSAPLEERRRRLLAIDWVEDASVSRVWPDRLAVRIQERRPVAFVLLHSNVRLIDAHGVLLNLPAQAQFTFPVLAGVHEDQTPEQRLDCVRAFLQVEQELGYLARDVSEINAADADDIRIVAQVENRAVELMLGDANYARRYQNFLAHYPEIAKRSPEVKTFDLRLDDRILAKEKE
ncbi:MAG: FtsQ-type POTRA domain-containing protein [Bryobacteraceae bacterium]|jgi:cell division protein FtsQ